MHPSDHLQKLSITTSPKQSVAVPPSWPTYAADEIAAATAVLRAGKVNYWTGEEGRQFEQEFAAYCGTEHAIALANGTLAIELALRALGIGHGDDVVVPPRTFIATASAVVMVGATPVFADVDANSQNMTADTIRAALTPKTRAVIPVHLAGWPCDMDPINDLAQERGLKVIEDCAQAHGATYHGRPVGSLGDVGAFSFCQDKIMTTGGEGGMLVTNDSAVWRAAWAFKDHGKNHDIVFNRQHPPGFRWLHDEFGTNWRLTELQSAIGRVQLRKLNKWVNGRQDNALILTKALSDCPVIRITEPPPNIGHAYYKYYAFVRPERLRTGWNRERIMNAITDTGTPCFSGICPEIYLEKAFQLNNMKPPSRLPVARELGETSLMFVVHPTLEARHMRATCDAVVTVLEKATQ